MIRTRMHTRTRAQTPTRALWMLLILVFTASAAAQAAEHAVIVVIDGMRATEGFDDPGFRFIPRMRWDLVPQGAWGRVCDNMGVTTTVPGHAAIGSGRYQDLLDDGTQRSVFPLLWEYYRKDTGAPERDVVIVTNKRKIRILSYSTWSGYGAADSARVIGPCYTDASTVNQFLADMAVNHPKLAFLNLGDVDYQGHYGTWTDYTRAIQNADSLVAYLWDRVQQDPVFGGATDVVITCDHGRHTDGYGSWHDHGDGCPGCRRIALLGLGPDFRAGLESWTACQQVDLCKTVASLLGIPTPLAGGRVLDELLQNPAAAEEPPRSAGLLRVAAMRRSVSFRLDGDHSPLAVGLYDPAGRCLARGTCEPWGTFTWESPAYGVLFYRADRADRGDSPAARGRIVLHP